MKILTHNGTRAYTKESLDANPPLRNYIKTRGREAKGETSTDTICYTIVRRTVRFHVPAVVIAKTLNLDLGSPGFDPGIYFQIPDPVVAREVTKESLDAKPFITQLHIKHVVGKQKGKAQLTLLC